MKSNAYLKYAQNNGIRDSGLNKSQQRNEAVAGKGWHTVNIFVLIMFFFVLKMRAIMENFYTGGDGLSKTEGKLILQEEYRVTDHVHPREFEMGDTGEATTYMHSNGKKVDYMHVDSNGFAGIRMQTYSYIMIVSIFR